MSILQAFQATLGRNPLPAILQHQYLRADYRSILRTIVQYQNICLRISWLLHDRCINTASGLSCTECYR